jgi:hypothetical protein
MSTTQGTSVIEAFEKYCMISDTSVQDQQFCYNVENMKKDIYRILALGADEFRVCKKLKAINPHFCPAVMTPKRDQASHVHVNERLKRGVIYI